MRDLVKLANRINQIIPDNRAWTQNIFLYAINDNFCSKIFSHLKPIEIIKIIFLIYNIRQGKTDLNTTLEELNNLFLFSAVRFTGKIEVSCNYCGGNGYVDCSECDGRGKIECDQCEGSGTEETDNGESDCSSCDGDGELDCNECNGGSVDCDDCDGSGSYEGDGLSYELSIYVSYNNKLKSIVKNLDNNLQQFKVTDYDITEKYPKTIMIRQVESEDDNLDEDFDGAFYVNGIIDSSEVEDALDVVDRGSSVLIYADDLEEVNKKFY